MKNLTLFLLFISSFALNTGCVVDEKCIADLTVSTLDAPAAVLAGNPIAIVCAIKNIVNTGISSCTSSGRSSVRVECAYSSEFKSNFNEYDTYDTQVFEGATLEAGQVQNDEAMFMPTELGKGFYAMRFTVMAENDNNDANDARAVVIEAN